MAGVAFLLIADADLVYYLISGSRLLAHLKKVKADRLDVACVPVFETRQRALIVALEVILLRLRRLELIDVTVGVEVLTLDKMGANQTLAQLASRIVVCSLFLCSSLLCFPLSRQE